MIDAAYVQTLAQYNLWQNDSLYAAAASLSDAQRREDRGAFFKSIHATLNHVLFGDQMWMSRFTDSRRPQTAFPGTELHGDWDELTGARKAFDARIVNWAAGLDAAALKGDLVWLSGLKQTAVKMPRWLAIAHFFNHQTHHRGQVHAMLTAAGAKPQDTDLIFMRERATAPLSSPFAEHQK